jgi:hypothetical protein
MAPENKRKMESLFKVGDRVKVNTGMGLPWDGHVATVVKVWRHGHDPYIYEYDIKFNTTFSSCSCVRDFIGGMRQYCLSFAD